MARYALDHGYHVIIEGILYADRYGSMLQALRDDHLGQTHCFYLEVPFEETLRRHATRAQASQFGAEEMRGWYRPVDLLPGGHERIISSRSTLAETIEQLIVATGLHPTNPSP
ncbi:hypothetical protein [Streptomyces sp. KR80]|uniref:hypothetical protein n=1 Tax=Streptomyces sp. KR80 TaxID=3457426 RepID=UPI003FD1955B